MSRWFRHYAGMMRDDKLVRAALRSKQPIERVVWVYGVILESAAEIDDGGRFDVEAAEIAHFLRADEADIVSVLAALEAMGRVHEGFVVKWGDRQFQSDKSAERQRRHREKRRSETITEVCGEVEPSGDGEVTPLSRHGDAPETETETETEQTDPEPRGSAPADLFMGEVEVLDEDPKAKLFRIGKTVLVSFGVSEKRTGALLGQWLKACPDPTGLLAAIQFARQQNVAEPISYISAVIAGKGSNNGRQPRQSLADRARELAEQARRIELAEGIGGPSDALGGYQHRQ